MGRTKKATAKEIKAKEEGKKESLHGGMNEVEARSELQGNDELHVQQQSLPHQLGSKRVETETETDQPEGRNKRQRTRGNAIDPYNDAVEKDVSRLAVDQACFIDAENLIPFVSKMVLDKYWALHDSGYRDDEIHNISKRLEEIASPMGRYKPVQPVGFLGDTAAGKSSLINSLLNQGNIAAESDRGSSGTHVIQEFRQAAPDQVEPFTAMVYYHPRKTTEQMIASHMATIYEFKHLDASEADPEEVSELEADSSTALDFISTLLCGRKEFRTTEDVAAFVESAESANDEAKLEHLKQCVQDYLLSLERVDGATALTASSRFDLARQLTKYSGPVTAKSSEDQSPMSSPWPLVSKITIFLRATILSGGLILADLPGLSDSNQIRVRTTREYLKTCGTIVVAHPASRIVSHNSVHEILSHCSYSNKTYATIVACTEIDDIKHGRDGTQLSEADQQTMNELAKKIKVISDSIEDLQDIQYDSGADEFRELFLKLRHREGEKALAIAEARGENISIRNRRIVSALQRKYKRITGDCEYDLPVICISTTIYQQHMEGSSLARAPDLTLHNTGVPALRTFLSAVPARKKMAELKSASLTRLPRILLAMELQCSKTRLEKRQELQNRVAQLSEQFELKVEQAAQDLKAAMTEAMHTLLSDHEANWKISAEKVFGPWALYKSGKFNSFCRREGLWKVAKGRDAPMIDWNKEINAIMTPDFEQSFEQLKKVASEVKAGFASWVDQEIIRLIEDLNGHGVDLRASCDIIKLMRQQLATDLRDVFRVIQNGMRDIEYDATSTASPHSYVVASMVEVYEACKLISGHESHKRRLEELKQKLVGARDVFYCVVNYAIADFDAAAAIWVKLINSRVLPRFQEIADEFNRLFDDKNEHVEETAEKRAFRTELLATVKEAKEIVDTKMKSLIAECETFD